MRSDFMDMFLALQQPTCYTEEITHAIMGLSFCLGGWDRSHLLAIHTIYLLIRILQRIQTTWYKILSIQLWLAACKWTFEKKLSVQLQIKWMMMRSVIGWWVVEKSDILLVFIHYGPWVEGLGPMNPTWMESLAEMRIPKGRLGSLHNEKSSIEAWLKPATEPFVSFDGPGRSGPITVMSQIG